LDKIRSHLEITLGRPDIDVTKVGRKLRQKTLNVLAGAIPREQAMYGCGMAKVVQAWRSRFADGAIDFGGSADVLKQ
jgi:hypothetical protein